MAAVMISDGGIVDILFAHELEPVRPYIKRLRAYLGTEIYSADFFKGYPNCPRVVIDSRWPWDLSHEWLRANIPQDDYTWFGHEFVFTHQKDADAFLNEGPRLVLSKP